MSSCRPFDKDPTGVYRFNQLAAKKSWDRVFSKIVYLNALEPELNSAKTVFIPAEEYPTISSMMEFCAAQQEWCCIVNSDIIIGAGFPMAEARLKAKHALCASSWRYNFDPALGIHTGIVDDLGIDFFAAVPSVWRHACQLIDPRLRIATGYWDTWLLAFFSGFYSHGFFNITRSKSILHPRHEGRVYGPGVDHKTVQVFGEARMSICHV